MAVFRLEGLKDIGSLVKELANGLRNLTFTNFKSFEWSGTIAASSSVTIRNLLTQVPKKYIIVSQEGNGLITKDSTNTWTTNSLYLQNNGLVDVTITVVFFLQ
jgi:hypothetical protein